MRVFRYLPVLLVCAACGDEPSRDLAAVFNPAAEQYVKLALALGEHDADYVDAYFGPEEWREQARAEAQSLAAIAAAAADLAAQVRSVAVADEDEMVRLRQDYIASHLESMATVARLRNGEQLSFDEESRLVYGFVAPSFPVADYDAVLAEIDALLPGDAPLHERVYEFELQFRIPTEKIEPVIRAGLDECRRRTLQYMTLPAGESFQLELVSGNPWGAYNWYKGGGQGLIQVETSRPKSVASSITLGCHEGYPGHHAFSSLLDENFLRKRGWVEFSVLPLFSPQGVIFEGSGDFAEQIAFPGPSRNEFLNDVILPLAGLDNLDFATRDRLKTLTAKTRYASIEAARNFLDGAWDRAQTGDWLTRYALTPPEELDAWFRFTERYRAYQINYVLGEDLVAAYIARENPAGDPDGNWRAMEKLLSRPPTPLLLAGD